MPARLEQRTLNAAAITLPLAQSIHALRLQAWPHIAQQKEGTAEFLIQKWRGYTGPEHHRPLYHLGYVDESLVAVAHTFARTVTTPERELTIMALASVCVACSERGHGYGRDVVRAAFARVDAGDFEFSLFQTTHAVEPFYRRMGAVQAENGFYNSFADDPTACPFWDPVAMRYPAGGNWPAGAIDLRGPGF